MDGELVVHATNHYALHSASSMMATANAISGLARRSNLEVNGDAGAMMYSSNVSTSISSSGVSSVSGAGSSNDASPSVSSYASACCSSSCNSSAADSTCSQSPPPPSSSSTNSTQSSSAKLACKLLAKLLTNSNGQLENEHLSAKNLQLKMQLNEQLNKQFNRINGGQTNGALHSAAAGHNGQSASREELSLINKSTSMSIINHNNNYLRNLEAYRPAEFKSSLVNKSMINLSQYNQLNDYQFKLDEHHQLNDEIVAVKTNGHLNQRFKLNNSTSNLSTFKSTAKVANKGSLVARQIEALNGSISHNQPHIVNGSHSSHPLSAAPDNNDEGLSSGSSSILSTFKYSDSSEKSFQTAKGTGFRFPDGYFRNFVELYC